MSFTILGITFRSKKEQLVFDKDMQLFIELHEKHHRKHWWRTCSFRDETEATKFAFDEMIKLGFSFAKLVEMETSYRLWEKYDLNLSEFIERMKK